MRKAVFPMSYQYTCVECGQVFMGKANPYDPTKPAPAYYRQKNPSFHYCPACQKTRTQTWMHRYHQEHAPRYNKRERKRLMRNAIEQAKDEWYQKVDYYPGEPAPNHVMWDFFPARQMENGEHVPAVNLIGTVTEKDLITRDNNGQWIRPRAAVQLQRSIDYQIILAREHKHRKYGMTNDQYRRWCKNNQAK